MNEEFVRINIVESMMMDARAFCFLDFSQMRVWDCEVCTTTEKKIKEKEKAKERERKEKGFFHCFDMDPFP